MIPHASRREYSDRAGVPRDHAERVRLVGHGALPVGARHQGHPAARPWQLALSVGGGGAEAHQISVGLRQYPGREGGCNSVPAWCPISPR